MEECRELLCVTVRGVVVCHSIEEPLQYVLTVLVKMEEAVVFKREESCAA